MALNLVVREAFGGYSIGDRITDADAVAKARVTHPGHVIPVIASDPAPAAAPAAPADASKT